MWQLGGDVTTSAALVDGSMIVPAGLMLAIVA